MRLEFSVHAPGVIAAIGHRDAVGPNKAPAVLKVLLNTKAAFMDERVMSGAQQNQVIDRGLATVRPVLDMMAIEEALVIAAGKRAAMIVTGSYHPGYRFGDDTRLAADAQRLCVVIFGNDDRLTVTAQAPDRFDRQCSTTVIAG